RTIAAVAPAGANRIGRLAAVSRLSAARANLRQLKAVVAGCGRALMRASRPSLCEGLLLNTVTGTDRQIPDGKTCIAERREKTDCRHTAFRSACSRPVTQGSPDLARP